MLGFEQMNALLKAFHGFNIGTRRSWNDVCADVDDCEVDVSAHNESQNGS
jgi:hypothetical protein